MNNQLAKASPALSVGQAIVISPSGWAIPANPGEQPFGYVAGVDNKLGTVSVYTVSGSHVSMYYSPVLNTDNSAFYELYNKYNRLKK